MAKVASDQMQVTWVRVSTEKQMGVLLGEDGGTVLLDIWGLQRPIAVAEAPAPRRAPATSLNDISPSQEALEPE